ncbi:Ig-like domain repeat protein [Methanosphaera cuniculi]|uniref:Ig-like domain repeat protein n=1 Tax=Methanosphaera cuniculi TaxID=1077256 RepID=UPI0026F08F09|nr:Ig-like domain repeat protein [Methanosphaera cuniculi]
MKINSVKNTTNTSLIKITGNDNKITTSLSASNFNKVTAISLENANNTIITGSSLSVSGVNATAVIFNNSNNNTLSFIQGYNSGYTITGTLSTQGLLFINSSYNKVNGNITQSQPVNYIIKLEDNSNFNEFKHMGVTNTYVVTTPILIIDSHNNIFYNNTFNFTNLHDYAINITESVGNKVEYNAIIAGSFKGNEAVVQENKNETINNQVRNNGESTGYITRLIITTPDTIKMLDTITITAAVDYNTGYSWRPNYVTATDGYVVFIVNGKQIANITIVNGKATANYTITPEDETLSIEALYENPKLTNQPALTTTTITPQKLESKVILANVTNNGVTTLITAIIIDEKGNIIYNGNVTFKIDDMEVKTIEIQNGVAQTTINVANISLGEHKLIAEYNGNTAYLISNATSTLTVNKFDANIMVEPVNITAGKTTTLKATVTDANGNKVNSGRVVFKLNGCTLKDANGKVIYAKVVDGIATINYMIPSTYTPKDYTLTAVASDNKYNRIEANTTLTVAKSTPKIQMPNTIKRTKNTQITINITDENGNKINSNQKVCLKFNGCTVTNTKAVNGTVTLNLDLTKYKNSQYEMTFICGENSKYNTSKLTSIVNIE